jgi:hypothetical protein
MPLSKHSFSFSSFRLLAVTATMGIVTFFSCRRMRVAS